MAAVDISKQIEDNQFRWYVLSVNSGQEGQTLENLKERVWKKEMGDEIIDYLNPVINEVYYKKWTKMIRQTKMYPGYLFIRCKMNEKIRYVIRNTPGVRLIVWAEIKPIPLTDKEYEEMVAHMEERNAKAEFAVPFDAWDVVTLRDGDFNGMKWVVTNIDAEKWMVSVNVEILWKNTPVMLSFDKVEADM